jgi:putative two-component system response regulator
MISRNPLAVRNEELAHSPILLIDDNSDNLKLLEHTLQWAGFTNLKSCRTAEEGWAAVTSFGPHLIILDLMMPVMSGYQFLQRMNESVFVSSFLPILVYSADITMDAKLRALELGASDFLQKPADPVEIQLRVRNFLRTRKMHKELENHNDILEAKVHCRTESLMTARREAVEILARVIEMRDDASGHYAVRMGELAAGIAHQMGRDSDFIESIRLVAPLHDIGMVGLPDSIIKNPGTLTNEEVRAMQRHVEIGGELIGKRISPLLRMARDIALYHHEWWDGSGYAGGLAGGAIPLAARIVSVADAFIAMTSDRSYRARRSAREALAELEALAGIQFDPEAVVAIRRYLESSVEQHEAAA